MKEEEIEEALNVPKLSALVGVDGQKLRAAVMRSQQGQPTRSDIILLADTFVKILTNPDDKAIQDVANLIKAGNNKAKPQTEPAEESVQLGECGEMTASPLSMMGAEQAPEQQDRYTLTITKGDGSSHYGSAGVITNNNVVGRLGTEPLKQEFFDKLQSIIHGVTGHNYETMYMFDKGSVS